MNLLQSEDSWSPYKTFFLIVLQFHKILHRVKKSDPYNEICIIFRNWNKSFIAFFYFLNKVYLNSGYVVSPNIQDKVRLCLHFINLSTPDNHLLNLSTKNVLSIFNIYTERCKKLQCLAIMLCNKNSTYVAHGGSCRRLTTPRLVAQTSRETTSTDSDTAYFFIQLVQYW